MDDVLGPVLVADVAEVLDDFTSAHFGPRARSWTGRAVQGAVWCCDVWGVGRFGVDFGCVGIVWVDEVAIEELVGG